MVNLCCMSFLGKENSSEIVVAGCQSIMYKIDIEKGHVTEEVKKKNLKIQKLNN